MQQEQQGQITCIKCGTILPNLLGCPTCKTGICDEVKVNDIFYASWGYEQTNIDFVKVIGISASGKTVKAVSIGAKTIKQLTDMSETVAPDPDHVISKEPVNLKITKSTWNATPEILLRGSYHYSSDGTSKHLGTLWRYKDPLYQSHYA